MFLLLKEKNDAFILFAIGSTILWFIFRFFQHVKWQVNVVVFNSGYRTTLLILLALKTYNICCPNCQSGFKSDKFFL